MKVQRITLLVPFDERLQPEPAKWNWAGIVGVAFHKPKVKLIHAGKVTDPEVTTTAVKR